MTEKLPIESERSEKSANLLYIYIFKHLKSNTEELLLYQVSILNR